MRFTRRELELQKTLSLEGYQNKVFLEAQRRLKTIHGIDKVCTDKLPQRIGLFQDDVESMVMDTLYYETGN